MTCTIIIDGLPKGKGRPRFTKSGHAYTPKATREYEDYVKYKYMQAKGGYIEVGKPIKVSIKAYYKIPKNTNKAERKLMLSGETFPCKKPDLDNIEKIICDALNGVAYYDDSQICKLEIEKMYSDEPRVEVTIEN